MDVRVEDYLNDKLQTDADLDSLDALIETAQQHQAQLKKQVCTPYAVSRPLLIVSQLDEANGNLREASDASAGYEDTLQTHISNFQGRQEDIDQRLKRLTQSNTSDEAVTKFEKTLSTLRRLDIAASYVGLLQEVDQLRFVLLSHRYPDCSLTYLPQLFSSPKIENSSSRSPTKLCPSPLDHGLAESSSTCR